MQGFVGGQWTYSLNANHPDGVALTEEKTLDAQNRRLALYFLGWESIEVRRLSEIVDVDNNSPRDTAAPRCQYNYHFRRGDG